MSPHATGVVHCAQHVRRAPRGGDAYQNILPAKVDFPQILLPQSPVVLRALHCPEHGVIASGNQTYHHVRICGISRGALHRVQHPQPSGRSAAAVDETASGLQLSGNDVHRESDALRFLFHSEGDFLVLVVYQADHIHCGERVYVGCAFIWFLGIA